MPWHNGKVCVDAKAGQPFAYELLALEQLLLGIGHRVLYQLPCGLSEGL